MTPGTSSFSRIGTPKLIERAAQLSRDLVELLGRDVEVAMSLFQHQRSASWLRGSERRGVRRP
jgi:hypothetical protein